MSRIHHGNRNMQLQWKLNLCGSNIWIYSTDKFIQTTKIAWTSKISKRNSQRTRKQYIRWMMMWIVDFGSKIYANTFSFRCFFFLRIYLNTILCAHCPLKYVKVHIIVDAMLVMRIYFFSFFLLRYRRIKIPLFFI